MLKNVDLAVYNTIESEVERHVRTRRRDLRPEPSSGVGYATSGGFIDAYVPTIEGLTALIVDGTIVVPTTVEE